MVVIDSQRLFPDSEGLIARITLREVVVIGNRKEWLVFG